MEIEEESKIEESMIGRSLQIINKRTNMMKVEVEMPKILSG
jgi:hypothetical protein